jgi:hypothetical protein
VRLVRRLALTLAILPTIALFALATPAEAYGCTKWDESGVCVERTRGSGNTVYFERAVCQADDTCKWVAYKTASTDSAEGKKAAASGDADKDAGGRGGGSEVAASGGVDVGDFPSVKQVRNANIGQVAATAVNFLLMLAGALAVIFLIVGGIRYIISAGSPDRIEKAKHTVLYAVIGIVVILLSYVIVNTLNRAG